MHGPLNKNRKALANAKTEISQRIALAQSLLQGKNIFQFLPFSDSAFEFEQLYQEIIRIRW